MAIVRGTTPKLRFKLPIEVNTIENVLISLAQNGSVVIEKKLSDCQVENTDTLAVILSQNETLLLSNAIKIQIQIKVKLKTGEVVASRVIITDVIKILSDEVI